MLNLKSKTTVANNDLSITGFLKSAKQDTGPYLTLEILQEVYYSDASNLDLECLE